MAITELNEQDCDTVREALQAADMFLAHPNLYDSQEVRDLVEQALTALEKE